MPQLSDILIGSTISFASKAANDNNSYYGIVNGILTSELAKQFDDIYTYNTSVQSVDPTVPDVKLQRFFIIQLLEKVDNSPRFTIPFSADWINLPTLKIIATQNTADITVFGVTSANAQDVINLLMANGFNAKINSFH